MFNLFNNNPESENAEVQTDLQRNDLEERDDLLNRIRELEEQLDQQENLLNRNRELEEQLDEQVGETNGHIEQYNKMKEKKDKLKRKVRTVSYIIIQLYSKSN
jgi:DNA repair exonuclease SbcCD ATPase subunit